MNVEKLPSGSYRVSKCVHGKRYRITYPEKPTKAKAEADIFELVSKDPEAPNGKMTFKVAAAKYVDMKKNVLSPNTVREYTRTCDRLSEWFVNMPIDEITQIEINKQINQLSADKSPKTVRNYHGFISSVLTTFRPTLKICTTLPQKRKNELYIPSDNDIKRLLTALQGTEYYIPVILACHGMRRGEICALTVDDIEGDIVHINKSLAFDVNNKLVLKSTKTTESERDIIIPMEIADLIREKGYIYNGFPNSISRYLVELEEKLGIEHFSLHKLRHYFASKMLTITDSKTVQALGGWKTDTVMKNIYAHSIKEEQEKAKRLAVQALKKNLLS